MILYGNPSAIAKDSSPHLRRHFLPNVQFEWCLILQGTLGGTFDIFAASVNPLLGCSSGKPRSRPIGVRVCPEAQFNFSSTAFAPRVWTMVVSWREDFGRQPQLITPENEGGDETNCPYPPNFTFFDDPDVPFGPQGPQPPAPPEPHEPPGSPGLPPGWLPATSPAGGRERVGTGNTSRERLHPRPSPPEPQLIPIPMSDGEDDDDQPPQGERLRERCRSRERVHPHVQVPQVPDFTAMNLSSPSAGPPLSAEQRGCCRRDERSRSRERVPPHSSSHADQEPQPILTPSGVQQTQTLATQGADEDSATVDPQNRVSDRSGSLQEQEYSQRQGPQKQKRKKTVAEKQPSELPEAKKHKSMDSDEDDEEIQNELGTSSNSQPTVPVLPDSQGPVASAISGDEDRKYSDECSAQSQDSGRTVLYPDFNVLTNDEH